jgi:hypothetical protein
MRDTILSLLSLSPVCDLRELRYALGCPTAFNDTLLGMADAGEIVLFGDAEPLAYQDFASDYIQDGSCFFTACSLAD